MKKTMIAAAFAASAIASTAAAAPVQWSTADGGNGHYYELVPHDDLGLNWSASNAAAMASTFMGANGYLATITSAAEQAFFDMLNPDNLKTWIGGSDAATEGDFEWVTTGETFDYTFWAAGEPNNVFAGSGGEDYILAFWRANGGWNDSRDRVGSSQAYLVEYEVSAVPLPASLPLVALGLGALGLMRRRRKAA